MAYVILATIAAPESTPLPPPPWYFNPGSLICPLIGTVLFLLFAYFFRTRQPKPLDIHKIAVRHRALVWSFLGYFVGIALYVLGEVASENQLTRPQAIHALNMGAIVFSLLLTVCFFRLALALYPLPTAIGLTILTFIPFVGLILFLVMNHAIVSFLRGNGIKVGLMGATDEAVESALSSQAEFNAKHARKPLHAAAFKGDIAVARCLIADQTEINAKDSGGESPLHLAASAGQLAMVELLLANQADVNATDSDGETPLHLAVFQGHKEVAKLLLANKAEVNAKDNDGETPMHVAVCEGHKNMAKLLRQHGGHK
ncbi:MAG: ankyrin repeat domain-containing protein [Tepidisphaeraceae bacterium]|jgi:ankyrin repeat protein